MKRLWSSDSYRLLTHIRQANSAHVSTLPPEEVRRRLLQSRRDRARKFKTRSVTAPENFSLVNNTNEVLAFLGAVAETAESDFHPSINLHDVKTIGPDAIAALISTVDAVGEIYQVNVSGNEPNVSAIAEVFRRSGFYEHVQPPKSLRRRNKSEDRGVIQRHRSAIVDGPVADQLIRFGYERVTGVQRSDWAMYDAIEEFMQNTFDHASRETCGKERWWASVQYDESEQIAHFTFLDNGVGIFGSRQLATMDKLRDMFDLPPDTTLLQEIFEGKLASRTGVQYRGQGLPRIYKHIKRGTLENLTVITNRVKGELHAGRFTPLDHEFSGTLYYWDLVKR